MYLRHHKQKHLLLQTLEKIDKELAQDDMEWGGFQDILIQAQSPVAVVLTSFFFFLLGF